MRVCAIDVGTNTLLGLVVERSGSIRALDDLEHITRLGRGVDANGQLAPAAIDRAMGALSAVVVRARELGAQRIAAVGTSAMRDARNASELIERAKGELGVEIEIIDGAREAALTFAGALPLVAIDDREELTIVDIGGGSTEIAQGRGGKLLRAVSLDVGSVRLFERHLRADPPTTEQIAALVADVDRAIDERGAPLGPSLVALAGTACTVAAIALALPLDAVHGARLSIDEIRTVADRMTAMRVAERRATPGVPEGREDVIAAGALLLLRIAERARATTIEVSTGGVRWGLALEMLEC